MFKAFVYLGYFYEYDVLMFAVLRFLGGLIFADLRIDCKGKHTLFPSSLLHERRPQTVLSQNVHRKNTLYLMMHPKRASDLRSTTDK